MEAEMNYTFVGRGDESRSDESWANGSWINGWWAIGLTGHGSRGQGSLDHGLIGYGLNGSWSWVTGHGSGSLTWEKTDNWSWVNEAWIIWLLVNGIWVNGWWRVVGLMG